MRWLALVVFAATVVMACGDDGGGNAQTCRYQDHDYAVGETWPAGDNCNDCTCTATGFECTARPCAAPPDADPTIACHPSGTCANGPACGASCCASGERCEGGTCLCGTSPACGAGDTCEAPGPLGGDACGSICCGASGPCPQ